MKKLYYITERTSPKKCETYPIMATEEEIKRILKAKREMYGYIPGVGGNRNYSCYATFATLTM